MPDIIDEDGVVIDDDAATAPAAEAAGFEWLPAITLREIGADRGAANRLGRKVVVAQIWGEATGVAETEPDARYGGRVWTAIQGNLQAQAFDAGTGQPTGLYASALCYLPRAFQLAMQGLIAELAGAGGDPLRFGLTIAVVPASTDGRWHAMCQLDGRSTDRLAELRRSMGIVIAPPARPLLPKS